MSLNSFTFIQLSANTPHLSQSDKASCEGKLTLQNIWEALSMKCESMYEV